MKSVLTSSFRGRLVGRILTLACVTAGLAIGPTTMHATGVTKIPDNSKVAEKLVVAQPSTIAAVTVAPAGAATAFSSQNLGANDDSGAVGQQFNSWTDDAARCATTTATFDLQANNFAAVTTAPPTNITVAFAMNGDDAQVSGNNTATGQTINVIASMTNNASATFSGADVNRDVTTNAPNNDARRHAGSEVNNGTGGDNFVPIT